MIHVCLTDDWELRGDGSGDPRVIQFSQMRRLCDTYEDAGVRGTFNVEVMQQLAHREFASQDPRLAIVADEWEAAVTHAYRRGHDVQLHVHPQWLDASHDGERWTLRSSWFLPEHPPEAVTEMIGNCRKYLESLMQGVDPGYSCVSFRAGGWAVAPSPCVLPALSANGIVFDMSVVGGLFFSRGVHSIDYRGVEVSDRPYYPCMHDARRVAAGPEAIVEVPTLSFDVPAIVAAGKMAARVAYRVTGERASLPFLGPAFCPIEGAGTSGYRGMFDRRGAATAEGPSGPHLGLVSRVARRARGTLSSVQDRRHCVSDLAQLSSVEARYLLRRLGLLAARSGITPVVLENHTKDVGSFAPIANFLAKLLQLPGVEVVTATQMAAHIRAGTYEIETRATA